MTISDMSSVDRAHWRLHLNAVVKDAEGIKNGSRRARVLRKANAVLSGGAVPSKFLHPSEIHDWIEKPEERVLRG